MHTRDMRIRVLINDEKDLLPVRFTALPSLRQRRDTIADTTSVGTDPSRHTRFSRTGGRIVASVTMSLAVATGMALAAPTATALPQVPPTPKVDQRTLDSMGAFAPALIGSVATPGPDGKINAQLLGQARSLASAPGVPPEVSSMWNSVVDFLGEPGRQELLRRQDVAERKPGDPEIPQGPNAPKIQQFLYPTLGFGCMPGGNSLGRALTTAGPQAAPAPGPKRGQAGYVFTALGTGPAVNHPGRPLWVSWLNIDNGRTGQTPLKRNPQINATDGPGTFTGIAKTGKGRVISTIYGDVTTKTKGRVISCTIAPTIGIAFI